MDDWVYSKIHFLESRSEWVIRFNWISFSSVCSAQDPFLPWCSTWDNRAMNPSFWINPSPGDCCVLPRSSGLQLFRWCADVAGGQTLASVFLQCTVAAGSWGWTQYVNKPKESALHEDSHTQRKPYVLHISAASRRVVRFKLGQQGELFVNVQVLGVELSKLSYKALILLKSGHSCTLNQVPRWSLQEMNPKRADTKTDLFSLKFPDWS